MTALPVVRRELRVAARQRRTYRTRLASATLALVVGAWVFVSALHLPPQIFGRMMLSSLAGLAFVYCLLIGVRVTADCLSEEKREGTMGLLFLTDLKGYDVVLGKLVACSLNAFYGLLAILPVLALPVMIGGVTLGDLLRLGTVLVNTLFFSVAAGLVVSALSRDDRRAVAGTFLLIGLIAGGLPAAGAMLQEYAKTHPAWILPELPFYLPSPGYAFSNALMTNLGGATANREFWWSLLATHGLAWGFVLAASLVAPHSWKDRPASERQQRWRERWRQWSFGSAAERRSFRDLMLGRNPYLWLAARDRFKVAMVWIFLGLALMGWLWGWMKLPDDWLNAPVAIISALLLHTTIKCWIASEAARAFIEDRRTGAIELLLSTPLSVAEILRGQLLALRRQFTAPLAAVLAADVVLMLLAFQDSSITGESRLEFCMTFAVGMLVLVADAGALAWVSMWLALATPKANLASLGAISRIMFLPSTFFFGCLILYESLSMRVAVRIDTVMVIMGWFGVALVTDILFFFWARGNLRQRFRELAMQRYQPPRARWRHLLRDWLGARQRRRQ